MPHCEIELAQRERAAAPDVPVRIIRVLCLQQF